MAVVNSPQDMYATRATVIRSNLKSVAYPGIMNTGYISSQRFALMRIYIHTELCVIKGRMVGGSAVTTCTENTDLCTKKVWNVGGRARHTQHPREATGEKQVEPELNEILAPPVAKAGWSVENVRPCQVESRWSGVCSRVEIHERVDHKRNKKKSRRMCAQRQKEARLQGPGCRPGPERLPLVREHRRDYRQ